MQEHIFESAILKIDFEPTNMIFVSSANNEVVGLTIVKKEEHYKYIELGKKQYCTLKIPN